MPKTAITLLVLLLASTSLTAQRRPASGAGGFWYAVGVAPGWARVSCQICAGNRRTGMSVFVGLGGSTSRALRIGGELAGWRDRDGNVTQTLMSVGAAAYWYPSLRRRLYLRGGAALVMHRVSDGTDVITSSGIGPQLGIGYEHAASRNWLVAPFAHYALGVFAGDVKNNGGQAAASARVSFLQVGVSLTRR
ncbi:MAG: hypothetical protein ACREMI_14210 [Gemmatimonadales bacterium]